MYPLSRHAKRRMQKRAIRPIVLDLLNTFGEEQFDGHGGTLLFFSRTSRQKIERTLGRRFITQYASALNCYVVESATDGTVITVGHRTKSIRRH